MDVQTRATLLEALRNDSDALAWDEFFRLYWPLIYGFAKRRGCSDHTAEEIVQEVMLTVFQQRDRPAHDPERGHFRDWLGTLVRNKLTDRRRRASERTRAPGGDAAVGLAEAAADEVPPEDAWEKAFEEGLLMALLHVVRQEVHPRTYQAFELYVLNDLSGAEVARLTGLSRNAIYQARKTVLKRLAELGTPYRESGQLTRRIKEALESLPSGQVERSMTTHLERMIQSRPELGEDP